jgi:hypothetical protein
VDIVTDGDVTCDEGYRDESLRSVSAADLPPLGFTTTYSMFAPPFLSSPDCR